MQNAVVEPVKDVFTPANDDLEQQNDVFTEQHVVVEPVKDFFTPANDVFMMVCKDLRRV